MKDKTILGAIWACMAIQLILIIAVCLSTYAGVPVSRGHEITLVVMIGAWACAGVIIIEVLGNIKRSNMREEYQRATEALASPSAATRKAEVYEKAEAFKARIEEHMARRSKAELYENAKKDAMSREEVDELITSALEREDIAEKAKKDKIEEDATINPNYKGLVISMPSIVGVNIIGALSEPEVLKWLLEIGNEVYLYHADTDKTYPITFIGYIPSESVIKYSISPCVLPEMGVTMRFISPNNTVFHQMPFWITGTTITVPTNRVYEPEDISMLEDSIDYTRLVIEPNV